MRPVNLIPSEQRHGQRASMRGGPLAYIVIGALVAALAGVTLLVVTSNQISERKTEIVQVEREDAVVKARADKLDAYTQFRSIHDQRVATVTSLANSRFDWERVMRELALVLPGDVWLTNLTGTDSPAATPDGGASVSLRSSVPGPALALIGCARSQDAIGGLVQALKDIDGVTRVGVESSALGSGSGGESVSSGSATPAGGGSSSCQTRDFIAQFQIIVAFDAAPVASNEATASTEAAAAPAPEATSESTESTEG